MAYKVENQGKWYYEIVERVKLHEKKNFQQKSLRKRNNRTLNKIIIKKILTRYQKNDMTAKTIFHIKDMITKTLKARKKRNSLNFHVKLNSIPTFFRDSFHRQQTFSIQKHFFQRISSNHFSKIIETFLEHSHHHSFDWTTSAVLTQVVLIQEVTQSHSSGFISINVEITNLFRLSIKTIHSNIKNFILPRFSKQQRFIAFFKFVNSVLFRSSRQKISFDVYINFADFMLFRFSKRRNSSINYINFADFIIFRSSRSQNPFATSFQFSRNSPYRFFVFISEIIISFFALKDIFFFKHQSLDFESTTITSRLSKNDLRIYIQTEFFSYHLILSPVNLKRTGKANHAKPPIKKKVVKKRIESNDKFDDDSNDKSNDKSNDGSVLLSIIKISSDSYEEFKKTNDKIKTFQKKLKKTKTRKKILKNTIKNYEKLWLNLTKKTKNFFKKKNIKSFLLSYDKAKTKFNATNTTLFQLHFKTKELGSLRLEK